MPMQQGNLDLNHDELLSTPCQIFDGVDARQISQELGLLDLVDVIPESVQVANNNLAFKMYFNPALAIARWGDIFEQIFLRLVRSDWKQQKINGQPTLISPSGMMQFIFMSPNEALCNQNDVITAGYPKGIATQLKLEANRSHYMDDKAIRTFIVYYQPCSKIDQEDSAVIPFEITYATGITPVKTSRDKTKCYPSNHTLRLIFNDPISDLSAYEAPQTDEGDDITEADFDGLEAI